MRRLATTLSLLLVWGAFGFGVNRFLESRKSTLGSAHPVVAPTTVKPLYKLPGTIYVTQGGRIYRLAGGYFTGLGALPAAAGDWMMPAAGPGGDLFAVARGANWSDVYEVNGSTGAVVRQLTHNATTTRHVELNAWSFWPHLAPDGTTAFIAYDGPKTGLTFEVDFAVWAGPVAGKLQAKQWTTPNGYTGGDASPVPLPGGGVLYASYSLTPDEKLVSRLAMVTTAGGDVTYLTSPADDCNAPAISPDGTHIAAICTSDTQAARLVVMPFAKGAVGPAKVLAAGCLCASPAWSPDGASLLYLAPADAAGLFQLWWLDRAIAAAPAAPRRITSDLDLDASSPPAWLHG